MSAQRIQKAILAHLKDVHHIKEELLHSTFKAQPELDNFVREIPLESNPAMLCC
jgi:hypothetical protein